MIKSKIAKMPEGEVILRLAFYILGLRRASRCLTVCLDRHHVKSHGTTIFNPKRFLTSHGWLQVERVGKYTCFGSYTKKGKKIVVSANSHGGDIVATVANRRIRVECKKGKLQRTKGNPENKLIHEANHRLNHVAVQCLP